MRVHVHATRYWRIFIHNIVSLGVQQLVISFIRINANDRVVNLIQGCVFIVWLEKTEHESRTISWNVNYLESKFPKPFFNGIIVYEEIVPIVYSTFVHDKFVDESFTYDMEIGKTDAGPLELFGKGW